LTRACDRVGAALIEPLEKRTLLSASLSFASPSSVSVGAEIESLALTDLNGDGVKDAVTANYNGTVSVMLGNGDGTFQAAQTISDGLANGAATLAVSSLTGNGFPDLVVGSASGSISILLGNGDGTFQSAQTIVASANQVDSIAISDVNGDNNPDVITANSNGTLSVLLGNGDGTFQTAAIVQLPNAEGANFLAAGDFNGQTDLAVANSQYNTLTVLLGNGNGTFAVNAEYIVANAPTSVAIGDFNGDDKPDIAVGGDGGSVSVLLGNGDGTFQTPDTFAVATNVDSISVADVDGDGKADLVLNSQLDGYDDAQVLLGNGDGTFAAPFTYYSNTSASSGATAAADVNGDARLDLITDNPGQYSFSVSLNQTTNIPIISLSDGIVVGAGTSGDDVATVSYSGGKVNVVIDGASNSFAIGSVTSLDLHMLAGNDSVTIGAGVPATFVGGMGGSDTIVAGNSAADTIHGGGDGSNDSLIGGSGADDLFAGVGDGNDTLIAGGGNTTLTGDAGNDSLDGHLGNDSLSGDSGNDTLVGTTSGTGIDTLVGGTGIDLISAGPNDSVSANSGSTVTSTAVATSLLFSQQPADATAGVALGAVTVTVEDQFGNVVTSDRSTVTLAVNSGAGAATGTLTAQAVNGVATFSNLTFDTAGAYTLRATDGSLTSAVSGSFNITAAAASQVVFTQPPTAATAGSTVTPPVTISVEDQFGNVVTTDNSNVTLAVNSGSGTLGGTPTIQAVNGVATFSDLSLSAADTYTLIATDGSLISAVSGSFVIS
jgi:Ca2+-binding RTX toxin-like protein